MTPKLMGLLALMPMLVLVLLAAKQDVSSHRISNKLVLVGVLLGLILNGMLPEGWGFNSQIPGALGWWAALKGLAIGMGLFLPLYLLRAMGAGDVKLMGMVGAFLGPNDVLGAVLATLVAGGVMALLVVMWSKQLSSMLQNIKYMFYGSAVKLSTGQAPLMNDLPVSVGKLPYALAISLGTFAYLIWQRLYL